MADMNDPAYWRQQAEEARAISEGMRDPSAKQIMLDIAERYGRLAEQAEQAKRYATALNRPASE